MDEKLSRSIQSDHPVPLPIPAPSRTLTAITNSFDAEAAETSIREHQRPQTFIDPGDALLVADIITAEVFEVHDFFPSVGCFGDVDESTTIANRIADKIDSEISSFCITDPANASPYSAPTVITYSPPLPDNPAWGLNPDAHFHDNDGSHAGSTPDHTDPTSPTVFCPLIDQIDGWIAEIVAFDYDDPSGVIEGSVECSDGIEIAGDINRMACTVFSNAVSFDTDGKTPWWLIDVWITHNLPTSLTFSFIGGLPWWLYDIWIGIYIFLRSATFSLALRPWWHYDVWLGNYVVFSSFHSLVLRILFLFSRCRFTTLENGGVLGYPILGNTLFVRMTSPGTSRSLTFVT